MPRPRKFSDQAERLVIGIASYAYEDVRRRGRAPRQPVIEQAMRALVKRGSSKDEEAAVGHWFETYTRPTRYAKLNEWGFIEPARPAKPHSSQVGAALLTEKEEEDKPSGPVDQSFIERARLTRHWAAWKEMDRRERLAFAGFLLEQDQLSRAWNLQRLGVVGITRFLNAVYDGCYDGLGYTPQAEIELFAQAKSYGVLALADGEEQRMAKRVYVTWRGWLRGGPALVFWNGASATSAIGRRRAMTRFLSWFLPFLA